MRLPQKVAIPHRQPGHQEDDLMGQRERTRERSVGACLPTRNSTVSCLGTGPTMATRREKEGQKGDTGGTHCWFLSGPRAVRHRDLREGNSLAFTGRLSAPGNPGNKMSEHSLGARRSRWSMSRTDKEQICQGR